MKKLMIAVAAIVSTVVANASSISWSAANAAVSGGDNPRSGYTFFLIDNNSAAGGFALNAITSAATDEALVAALKSATGAALISVDAAWTGSDSTGWKAKVPSFTTDTKPQDGYNIGDTPSYYTLLLDASDVDGADKYLVTTLKTGTVGSTGGLTLSFGSLSALSWNSVPSSGDVPEPTSAMLLLLGVAGLALRRRA